jgi:hypothetical protein
MKGDYLLVSKQTQEDFGNCVVTATECLQLFNQET